jgi:alkylhydroperoxidase/carboxymuconolactone decarboxylase family protein YurZ
MPDDPHQLLRELAAGDQGSLEAVMAPRPELGLCDPLGQALDRRTKMLVRLAALLAVGASTTSLRWAVEMASTNGAEDACLAAVLLASAPATGTARVVETAPRLALALGYDVEVGGRDRA